MTVVSSPTDRNWTHHIKLSGYDANWNRVEIGLNGLNRNGTPDIGSIRSTPYPKTTTRVNTGQGEFSMLRPPYGEFSRSDWSGGIGGINSDDDQTRYYFGKRVWSVVPNQMTLAPKLFKAIIAEPVRTGNWQDIYNVDSAMPTPSSNWADYYALEANKLFAWKVSPGYTVDSVDVLIRAYEEGTINFYVCADADGEVGGLNTANKVIIDDIRIGSHYYRFALNGLTLAANGLPAGTYWFVITTTMDVEIASSKQCVFTTKAAVWTNPPTWTDITNTCIPVFSMNNDADVAADWIFFKYRGALYAVTGQRLFINGDRGACDANTGALTTLVDATKNWATDCWKGAIVRVEGLGEDGWRTILSNTTTTLTLDRAWDAAHTTADNYTILGTTRWTEISTPGFTANVKSVAVSQERIVYFAQGDAVQLRKMYEYNNSGTWTRAFADETTAGANPGASVILAGFEQGDGAVVHRLVNATGQYSKAKAVAWGTGATNLVWGTGVTVGSDNFESMTGMADMGDEVAVLAQDSLFFVKSGVARKGSIDMSQQWTWHTGRRPCLMTPFLVFPFGSRIQRYYNDICESFGPEMAGGIPATYDGDVVDTIPLLADCVMVKDGGHGDVYYKGGEGGAYLYRSGGWHSLAHTGEDNRMKAVYYQRIDNEMDMIWFGDRNGLWCMYMSRGYDYVRDTHYDMADRLEHDGWFVSGWYDTGRVQPDKWWDFITLFNARSTSALKVKVYSQVSSGVEYEYDNLASDWEYVGETDASDYSTTLDIDTNGQRIRFLFLLVGTGSNTPILEGYSVNYLSKDDDAESWNLMVRLSDLSYNLLGKPNDYETASAAIAVLNFWARTCLPVTMTSIFSPWNNRSVTLMRPGLVPASLTPELQEGLYANITILSAEKPTTAPTPYHLLVSGNATVLDTTPAFDKYTLEVVTASTSDSALCNTAYVIRSAIPYTKLSIEYTLNYSTDNGVTWKPSTVGIVSNAMVEANIYTHDSDGNEYIGHWLSYTSGYTADGTGSMDIVWSSSEIGTNKHEAANIEIRFSRTSYDPTSQYLHRLTIDSVLLSNAVPAI